MVEVSFYIIIYREENHTDSIPHIGLATGPIPSAIQAMTGLPRILLARHFQKVTGVNRENTGFRNPNGIEGVRQPGKYGIVGLDHDSGRIVPMLTLYPFDLVLIQSEFDAEPVDDPAGLLTLSTLNASVVSLFSWMRVGWPQQGH